MDSADTRRKHLNEVRASMTRGDHNTVPASTPPIEQSGLVEADVSIAARTVRQTLRGYGHNSADTSLPELIAASVCKALTTAHKARDEALEEAAKVAEDRYLETDWQEPGQRIAQAIRSLKGAAK